MGEYYFEDNLSIPGEYTVDVIASYLGKSVSNTSAMFVIGNIIGAGSGNASPFANAGDDQNLKDGDGFNLGDTVTLDGSASSDPESDPITFLWSVTSEPLGSTISLSSTTAISPTFMANELGSYVIQLVVSDDRGKSSSDTVKITVT